MDKLRISVYIDENHNKNGQRVVRFLRDDLITIQKGIIDQEEDINIEIIEITENQIIINADGDKYNLQKESSIEFDCCTGYYCGVSSDNQYSFIISWETQDIISYEETKLDLNVDYIIDEGE